MLPKDIKKRLLKDKRIRSFHNGREYMRGYVTEDGRFVRPDAPLIPLQGDFRFLSLEPNVLEQLNLIAVTNMEFEIRAKYQTYGNRTIKVTVDEFKKFSHLAELGPPSDVRVQWIFNIAKYDAAMLKEKNQLKLFDDEEV